MGRPVTLMTAQWGDLGFEELCKLAKEMGYDGLEITCGPHLDTEKAAKDQGYCDEIIATMAKYGLKSWALSAHMTGQCVGDKWDPRLDGFAPNALAGKPEEIRAWAIQDMKYVAQAAKNLGIEVVTGFMGSPIWAYWYSFPQTTEEMIDAGFAEIVELWTPIFDEFDKCGVKFALEVHPTEIAFDYYTAARLLEEFDYRETLGFNFDPSHLLWQGVNPTIFLRDFIDFVYHVHMKDAAVTLDGKAGILGSFITFGETERGWNFRSLGHGDVNFEEIIRELNQYGYDGPLSVEWEDSGMERVYGGTEAAAFVRKVDFKPSDVAFDKAMANE
ncbi:sugar phosphate isomerase/epimerase [Christensenellaceae bacterium OttesenSCG-928-K19]|nr:sugar phosphate isomerase/epimerase [Christensenellaceae bacterium OttesenSCG-928-K19]